MGKLQLLFCYMAITYPPNDLLNMYVYAHSAAVGSGQRSIFLQCFVMHFIMAKVLIRGCRRQLNSTRTMSTAHSEIREHHREEAETMFRGCGSLTCTLELTAIVMTCTNLHRAMPTLNREREKGSESHLVNALA